MLNLTGILHMMKAPKRAKLLIFLAVFFCFICGFSIAAGSAKPADTYLCAELSDKLLRFRVLANSDSTADQFQKNRVSERLVSLLRPVLSECSSKEEAAGKLQELLPALEKAAAALAAEYGDAYPVRCALAPHLFPVRLYGHLTFPAGTYDTLLVTIGAGEGSNWWCLAFPPLCFAEESYAAVPDETEETLREILSSDAFAAIGGQGKGDGSAGSSRPADDRQQQKTGRKPSFRFRLLPFLNDWFSL